MPKNRMILVIGVLVALLPVLGFPGSWEAFFQVLAGLSIVALSIWSTIDKKLMLKAKAQMRQARKVASDASFASLETPPPPPENPTFGKRVTDFYPKTAPPGRRLGDIKPAIEPPNEPPASKDAPEL
jgi:hypothetical protein